jgi:uncharacterized protein (TIGR02996 family)
MRTFQYSDATSHKFWNIEVTGKSFTVTFGKLGTAGQKQTKTFPTADKAQAEADKLIKEKTKKGYVETTPKTSVSESEAFENAIRANPHDVAAISAYADWLFEHNDPSGEFMQVQLALENESLSKDERKKLQTREKELLKKHEKEWVGEWVNRIASHGTDSGQVDPTGGVKYVFERGILTTVNIGDLTVVGARALVTAKETKLVQNLFVGHVSYEGRSEDEEEDEDSEPVALTGPDIPADAERYVGQYPLLRWSQLRYIRRFGWGYPAEENYGDWASHTCRVPGEHVYDFVKQMPDVEELHIFAHVRDATKLVALPMPNLRIFELYHGWSYPLEKLAKNSSLTKLTHIHCHPHGLEPGDTPYIRLPGLRAICRSQHLKSLTHLRLRLTDFGDKGAKEIVESGMLKRLKVLDLRHGCMTDEGARTLASCPDLVKLELLDISHNALTSAGIAALKKTGVKLAIAHMHQETEYDPDDFSEYLGHGDAE